MSLHSILGFVRIELVMTVLTATAEPASAHFAAAKGGDDQAFAAIVRQQQSMVFSIAFHATRNRAAAEEVAQDVFLQLYRNLEKIENAQHLVQWLRRATTNRCIDLLRKSTELPISDLNEVPVSPKEDRDFFLHQRLRAAVAELPADQRLAVILRYQEELDPQEISTALEVPVNTIKSQLQRALAAIRVRLGVTMGSKRETKQ